MKSYITDLELSEFLKDYEQNSTLELLEDSGKQNEIEAIAKVRGIKLKDSKDLAGFKCVYTFANIANKNKARLPKNELLRALPTLIGKPVDIDHNRRRVVGHFLDYKYILDEDKVVAYGVFYKSNFGDEWEEAKKLFKAQKLTHSYEIWSPKDKRKSLSDGTYELYHMEIAGGALLFKEEPAFEDAKVLELAKKNSEASVDEMVYAKKYCSSDIIVGSGNVACVECGKCHHLPETADVPPSIVQPNPNTPNQIKCINCNEIFDYYKSGEIKCPKCFAILDEQGIMKYPPQIIDFHVLCPSCQINKWLILSKTENDTKVKCLQCSKEYEMTFTKRQISEDINKLNFVYSGMTNCYQCNQPIDFYSVSSLKQKDLTCPKCGLQFLFDTSKDYNKKIAKISEIDNKLKSSEKGGPEMKDDNVIKASEITEPVVENKEAIVESQISVSDAPVETVSETPVVATTEVPVEPVIETPVEPTTEVIVESIPENPVETKTEEVIQAQEQPEAPVEEQGNEAPKAEETTPIVESTTIVESKFNYEVIDSELLEEVKVEGVEEAKKLTYQEKKEIPDNLFAVIVKVKNKVTGGERKIRMFPIADEAHVRNALARLGQPGPQATLKKLGVSVEAVKTKILRRAKELKMTQLLERYKAGVRRLAQKCRDEKKKNKKMQNDWEESKINAVEIARRRLELGEKAIKLSDVEIMDDNKFTQAKADIVNASIVQSTIVGIKPKDTDKYTKLRTEIDKEAFGKK